MAFALRNARAARAMCRWCNWAHYARVRTGRCPWRVRFRARARPCAPAGLQAEERAAVVDQIELHVAAAPVGLETALAFTEGTRLIALDDRHIGVEERITDGAQQRETSFEAEF